MRTHRWKDLLTDLVTGLSESTDCKGDSVDSILVIVDRLTKIIHYELVQITTDAPGGKIYSCYLSRVTARAKTPPGRGGCTKTLRERYENVRHLEQHGLYKGSEAGHLSGLGLSGAAPASTFPPLQWLVVSDT